MEGCEDRWRRGPTDREGGLRLDPNPKRTAGIGGRYVLHFKATKAAKTKIHLVYVRPWEKDKPPAKTFETVIDSTDRKP